MEENDFPESLQHRYISIGTAHECFCSLYYLLFRTAQPPKSSFVFIAFRPQLFKQAHDEYNDDGLDALYHHLVLVLYESGCHITMKYSSMLSIHPCALTL